MTEELKDNITEKIIKEIQENDKERSKENEEYLLFKNGLQDGLKSVLIETLSQRKVQKSEKDEILKERDNLKGKQNQRRETEKKLQDIVSELYDLNTSINIYKEISNSGLQSDYVDKAFAVINQKKEDQYRNDIKKMTPKDKQNALKILDEIKQLGLKISEDIVKKLNEVAGI